VTDDSSSDDVQDLAQADFLTCARTLEHADVRGWGRVYFYTPVSLAEARVAQRHQRTDGETISIDLEGVADGLIARLKDRNGQPLLFGHHKRRLMDQDVSKLMAVWNAIGGVASGDLVEIIEDAEKK